MKLLPESIERAIEALSTLPGIGNRSAERLVLTLLRNPQGLENTIGEALINLKKNLKECDRCCHYTETTLCPICFDDLRDKHTLCIIEASTDLLALERTHTYKGQYHVLHGVLSPLQKTRPEDIRLGELFTRIQEEPIEEVVLALSSNTESEATCLYIQEHIKPFFKGKITRLARGIPSGGDLDYLDMGTLSRALQERREA